MASLTGCGGGGSDTTVESNAISSALTKTGYFIDAEVKGLEYKTSSEISGKTNSLGQFYYKEGDTITFNIGQLELGSAKPDSTGLITPKELAKNAAPGDQDKAEEIKLLLLRLLQSLDIDKKPENGITITQG